MDETNPEEQLLDTDVQEDKHSLEIWSKGSVEVTETQTIKRLTLKNLLAEIGDAFNLNKGFFYTMKGLTIHPAKTIRQYLDTDRFKVVSPTRYFIVIVGISLFIANYMGFFEASSAVDQFRAGFEGSGGEEDAVQMEEVTKNIELAYELYFVKYQNVWSILTIFFSSIFSFLFFKKSGYNFTENMAINTYIFTHSYIPFTILVLFGIGNSLWIFGYFAIYFGMLIIVYKKTFNQSWLKTTFKTILATGISWILFMLLIMVGLLIVVYNTMKAGAS